MSLRHQNHPNVANLPLACCCISFRRSHFLDVPTDGDDHDNVRQQSSLVARQQLHRTAHVATQTQPVVQPPPELQPGAAATPVAVAKTAAGQLRKPEFRPKPTATGAKPKGYQGKRYGFKLCLSE